MIRTSDMGRRGPLPRKRRKIADWVRREIVRGEFREGDLLPDRKWFMREFAANRHSVQNAFDELVKSGFVNAVRGHGTRVADRMPFANRYLLLVKSVPDDAGSRIFAAALKVAAKKASARRGVVFEVADIADAPSGSHEYDEFLVRIRRHDFAGVFCQNVTKGHGFETVTNIDYVPIVFVGVRSDKTMGRFAQGIGGWASSDVYRRLFADCRDAGRRRIAVFSPIPVGDVAVRRERVAALAAEAGLEIVPGGYQMFSMRVWNDYQYRSFLELFFASDAGRAAEAVVLADDNFLVPFVDVCRERFGREAKSRFFIASHCNRPMIPKTDFPVCFRGIDWTATLEAFIDYSSDVRAHVRSVREPKAVLF